MSAASDAYEQTIAQTINSIPGIKAKRPPGDTGLSDVLIEQFNKRNVRSWVEVKMSHSDNLSNPRVFYKSGVWQTTYSTPAAKAAVKILNESAQAKAFLSDIAKFAKIPLRDLSIPTTKSGLLDKNAVPLDVMKKYFDQPGINRYIANQANYDLGRLVTEHYTVGKKEPAHYMQAGDDFYLISRTNPLGLPSDITVLSGQGDFKVRIATRSAFYEVQAEIKITNMPNSKYSLKPGTNKLNPFLR